MAIARKIAIVSPHKSGSTSWGYTSKYEENLWLSL